MTTIAIGDIHADPESFIDALMGAGVLDKNGQFVGKNIDLVLLGDFADKGHNTLAVWDIIHYLEKEARKNNARVHSLFGNHDTVIMMGELKRMKPNDLENFKAFDPDPVIGLKKALVTEPYESMMQGWKAMVKIGDDVFVHGGLDSWILNTSPEQINEEVHDYVLKQQDYIRASLRDPLAKAPEVPWVLRPWKFDSDTPFPDNPFWTRQMSTEKVETQVLDEVLDHVGAKRIVVGHTPTKSKNIETSYDERLIRADTNNSRAFKKGKISAVKIQGEEIEFLNGLTRGVSESGYKQILRGIRPPCHKLMFKFFSYQ